jgi:hypothetical protein
VLAQFFFLIYKYDTNFFQDARLKKFWVDFTGNFTRQARLWLLKLGVDISIGWA